jgi:hypothetical protein
LLREELTPIGSEGDSRKQKAAEERNLMSVSEANRKDEKLLSEYLWENIEDILPGPSYCGPRQCV